MPHPAAHWAVRRTRRRRGRWGRGLCGAVRLWLAVAAGTGPAHRCAFKGPRARVQPGEPPGSGGLDPLPAGREELGAERGGRGMVSSHLTRGLKQHREHPQPTGSLEPHMR